MRVQTIVMILGLVLITALGCTKKPSSAGGMGGLMAGGPPPVAVIVEPVVLQDYAPAIDLVGDIRAAQRAVLSAEVSGTVVKIAHRVGEHHPLGAGPLIQIDPSTYHAGLDAARAQLTSAEEGLRLAQNGPRPQEIAAQEAAVKAAQAQYDQALDNLKRQQELFAQGVVPESALVAAQSQAEAAQAALDAQQEVLDQLLAGTREEDLARAAAAVDAAKAAVTQAEIALSKTSISPLFDAMVTALMVEVGTSVGPGTPLCEVIAANDSEAWFNVPETDAPRVKPGAVVEVRLDALPGVVLAGSVISLSPAADPATRQFPVRVAVNDERARAGMAARARILLEQPTPAVMVSENATLQSKLGLVVYRMVPAGPNDKPAIEGMPALPSVETVLVEVGEHIDGKVVVTKSQLKPGDMVVTRGKEQLYPSAKIIPTNLMGQGQGQAPGAAASPGAAGAAPTPAPAADSGAPGGAGATTPPPEAAPKNSADDGQVGGGK